MQGLVIRSCLCLPARQTLAHCHVIPCRRRGLRAVCSAESAVTDTPPKRKPGRPKKTQTQQPDPAPATEAVAAQPKETKSRKKKVKEPDSDEDEESYFQPAFKAPWEYLSEEQIEQQNREVEARLAVRAAAIQEQAHREKWLARESNYNEYVYRDPEYLQVESKLLEDTDFGWQPNRGYFGNGQPQWWALNVHSAKRMKKVADFMALEVERLPPLEGEPDQPRLFETWLPSKVIKAYSLRTEKMGTKTVKYGFGMLMLVKAVMDEELFQLIDGNIYVGSFGDSEAVVDRDGNNHVVPKPCTAKYIAEIETWEKTKEVLTKEEVMLSEFGYANERAIPASNRMDTDEEYVEVYDDEDDDLNVPVSESRAKQPSQLRRYKDDAYRGSYNNPSNWYRGASDAGAGAGMGPAERSGAGQRSAAGAGVGTGAGAGARAGQDSYREARAGQDSYREARAGQDSRREARAGQDSRREARVGQTARAEARQEARMGSAQDRRAARSSKAWDTGRASSSEPSRQQQPQSRERKFNPRDWQGNSAAPTPPAGQPAPRQQPAPPTGPPSSSPARTASWWLGGNQPNAAGVPDLNGEAGVDAWEPTGAGRKGWYSPQASPSSQPSSDAGKAERMGDPRQPPRPQDWRSRTPPVGRNRGPSAPYDDGRDTHTADWSRQPSQSEGAKASNNAPGAASANYDAQLQKPVLQGRAKEIKKAPRGPMRMKQLRNHGQYQDTDFVGKRGAVGKSTGYDPIQKFDTVKLDENKPANWIRDDEATADADEAFQMPSFEHLEGEQWTDSSLQFNNVPNAASGSHLDQWKKENQDWRSDVQFQTQTSPGQGDSVPPPPPPSSSSSVPTPTLPGNPESGTVDEWGRPVGLLFRKPSTSQQPAAATTQSPTTPKSAEELQPTSSNAVSWDTGGFDFADMSTDAGVNRETGTGSGRNRREQSRADTRKPSRERKQGRFQESPRGRSTDSGATRQLSAKVSSNEQQESAQRRTDSEPADDFESFWNQF